jgi:predicted DNA-binding transcriptional regulator AlpA
MNRNEFPRCIKLSARAAAWDVEEVEDWMEERLAARDAERRDERAAEVAS